MKKKIKISEVKQLLKLGKRIKVKTINNEYTEIKDYVEKGINPTWEVELENNNKIKVTSTHRFFSNSGWIRTKDMIVGETLLLCDDGNYSKVKNIKFIGHYSIVDISVQHPEECYFGNGILNHNTGKSFMASLIAINAQKQGFDVVYFDTEKGIGKDFLGKMGCNFDEMLYVQPSTVEDLFEMIEKCLVTADPKENKLFFVWDSLAMTPTRELQESESVDPKRHGMRKALVMNNAWTKLLIPFNKAEATMVITNHLRDNTKLETFIKYPTIEQKYVTPGGKTLSYIYDMRIWLVTPRSKSSFIIYKDSNGSIERKQNNDKSSDGWQVGSTVRAKIIKSRHGTKGRECEFKILWGDEERVGVQEEDNIIEIVKKSDDYAAGQWHVLKYDDETEEKFRVSKFYTLFEKNEKFHNKIIDILKEELITKFQKKIGNAQDYLGLPFEEKDEEEIS